VFGMSCLRQDYILERRYFIIDTKYHETSLFIIVREIEPKIIVYLDEERA
jgi:hypothetical protein